MSHNKLLIALSVCAAVSCMSEAMSKTKVQSNTSIKFQSESHAEMDSKPSADQKDEPTEPSKASEKEKSSSVQAKSNTKASASFSLRAESNDKPSSEDDDVETDRPSSSTTVNALAETTSTITSNTAVEASQRADGFVTDALDTVVEAQDEMKTQIGKVNEEAIILIKTTQHQLDASADTSASIIQNAEGEVTAFDQTTQAMVGTVQALDLGIQGNAEETDSVTTPDDELPNPEVTDEAALDSGLGLTSGLEKELDATALATVDETLSISESDALKPNLNSAVNSTAKAAVNSSVKGAVNNAVEGAVKGAVKTAVKGAIDSAVKGAIESSIKDSLDLGI